MVHMHLNPPGDILQPERLLEGSREFAHVPSHVHRRLSQRESPHPLARSVTKKNILKGAFQSDSVLDRTYCCKGFF